MRVVRPARQIAAAPAARHRAPTAALGVNRALVVAVALAVAAPPAGCTDFEDPTTVKDLRLLAVVADPPEIFLDDFDNPGVVPPATVSALVADPAGAGRPVEGRAVACPYFVDSITTATATRAILCESLPAELRRELPVTDAVTSSHHRLVTTLAFDDTTSGLFALASPNDRIYGLTIEIEWQITAGDEATTGIKRMRYTQPQPGWGQTPNRNPGLDGIRAFRVRDEATGALSDEIPPEQLPVVLPSDHLFIEPVPAADAVETSYVTPVATSATDATPIPTVIERERVRFSFFASYGTFAPAVTSTELPALFTPGQRIRTESRYDIPKADAPWPADGHVDIWIVARDERGGESWLHRDLVLGP